MLFSLTADFVYSAGAKSQVSFVLALAHSSLLNDGMMQKLEVKAVGAHVIVVCTVREIACEQKSLPLPDKLRCSSCPGWLSTAERGEMSWGHCAFEWGCYGPL